MHLLYPLLTVKNLLTNIIILDMTLNCIFGGGFSSQILGSVDNLFIGITPLVTQYGLTVSNIFSYNKTNHKNIYLKKQLHKKRKSAPKMSRIPKPLGMK